MPYLKKALTNKSMLFGWSNFGDDFDVIYTYCTYLYNFHFSTSTSSQNSINRFSDLCGTLTT